MSNQQDPAASHALAREDITFRSGSETCAAWWYPSSGRELAPVVVLGIGLGSVKEMGLDRYAAALSARGYAALAFDYRGFGGSTGEPRQVIDVEAQLADWRAAVDFVRGQPGVDSERVVLWGTSFAGGHVIALAAERPGGVVAALAQCPFTDGIASALATSPISSLRLGVPGIRDLLRARRGKPPVLVATAGRPHSAALMSAHDALDGFLGLVPGGAETFRNEVAGRIALRIMRYRPGLRARDVQVPLWVGVCDQDNVAPPRRTTKLVRLAPRATVQHYDTGHFAIYHDPWFERAVADQATFLAENVPVTGGDKAEPTVDSGDRATGSA